MSKKYTIVIVLLIIYHALSYSWEAFSIDVWVKPFPFMVYDGEFESGIRLVTYISYVSNFIRHIIIAAIILLIAPKNTVLGEVGIISIIICTFDLFWYVVYYNNPFSIPELVIKGFIVLLIFIIAIYTRDGTSNINSDG
jgi:hypothetical protein